MFDPSATLAGLFNMLTDIVLTGLSALWLPIAWLIIYPLQAVFSLFV